MKQFISFLFLLGLFFLIVPTGCEFETGSVNTIDSLSIARDSIINARIDTLRKHYTAMKAEMIILNETIQATNARLDTIENQYRGQLRFNKMPVRITPLQGDIHYLSNIDTVTAMYEWDNYISDDIAGYILYYQYMDAEPPDSIITCDTTVTLNLIDGNYKLYLKVYGAWGMSGKSKTLYDTLKVRN